MEPSKFATMLHKNTNKITRILIYVVLEWTLIFLLLLNSLFSYFILKFALYFGLKPPCLFCSRLDHVLNSQKNDKKTFSSYTEFICEQHATEVSKIGYCSNHRKLVESKKFCDDCSSSSLPQHDNGPFFKWMKEIGIVESVEEGEDDIKKCSCCDVMINPRKVSSSPYIDYMANLITERELDGCFPDQEKGDVVINQRDLVSFDQFDSGYQVLDDDDDEEEEEDENERENDVVLEAEKEPLLSGIDDDDDNNNNNDNNMSNNNMIVTTQNLCSEMLPQHLEFYIDHDDYRLIPVEVVGGSVKVESNNEESMKEENNSLEKDGKIETLDEICRDEVDFVFEKDELMACCKVSAKILPSIQEEEEEEVENLLSVEEHSQVSQLSPEFDEEKREIENFCVLQEEENSHVFESTHVLQEMVEDGQEIDTENGVNSASAVYKEDMESLLGRDEYGEVLIEVDEDTTINDKGVCEVSNSSMQLPSTDENDAEVDAEEEIDIGTSTEINEGTLNVNVGLPHNEIEEDKIPDTPNSTESLNMHRKMILLGRRGSTTEESVDGSSIISENEGADGVTLIEKLKLELQTERKTLRALYSELEEERNASAIAANQTMAMINRLQEEKATMQMEALQYQRMMEEQSEYDQEALQMMNELMVKREKEKQELEKELEVYRKKLLDFEEREKMRILSRRMEGSLRSRNSSASCSYGEESDGLSIDLNHEVKDQEEDGGNNQHCREENGIQDQDTPIDSVLNLQESLGSFEDERQSILEQLKVLEEKLFTLAEEEEEDEDNTENMRQFEELYEENGKDFEEANGGENGKHQEGWLNGSMPKRLLPLFDAVELSESPDGMLDMVVNKSHMTKFELEKKRLAIEVEVDHVYERLHALEADREFLKHCIGSLRKGDKGLDLLQEILQHLRDLKNVELQVMKNMDPCASV